MIPADDEGGGEVLLTPGLREIQQLKARVAAESAGGREPDQSDLDRLAALVRANGGTGFEDIPPPEWPE